MSQPPFDTWPQQGQQPPFDPWAARDQQLPRGQQRPQQQYAQQQPWQPQEYDPAAHQRRTQGEPQRGSMEPYPPRAPQQQPHARAPRKTSLTAAEKFWYVLGCIPMGAAYFAKIPAKKALSDFGMAELTAAEGFWYVLMCLAFGGGYFAKISMAKAVSEMGQFR